MATAVELTNSIALAFITQGSRHDFSMRSIIELLALVCLLPSTGVRAIQQKHGVSAARHCQLGISRAFSFCVQGLPENVDDELDLAKEFNKRLEMEGGPTAFKVRSNINDVRDAAKTSARKVTAIGEDVADAAGSLTSRLTEQQKNIAKIILALIAFQIAIQTIAGVFGSR